MTWVQTRASGFPDCPDIDAPNPSPSSSPPSWLRARTLAPGVVADPAKLRTGDACEVLANDLPASIDLVLLDGGKARYPAVLALIEKPCSREH